MNLTKFGENLKELIGERNLTAKQFAVEIGVAPPTVTRYINGIRMPDINNLVLIADYFNCSIDYLFHREADNEYLTFKKCPPFSKQIEILAKHFCSSFTEFYTTAKISESEFYDWKNGKKIPTLESIIRIADKFECRIDYVVGREK